MLRYEYIRKEWIVSPTARFVYRAAAVTSLALFPLLIAVQLFELIHPLLRALVFLAVVGAALNVMAMEYFLFRFDDSRALKQVFWFCVMLFIPLGPALYCFIVYSRSALIRNSGADQQGMPRLF
jgi:hypothetical protein